MGETIMIQNKEPTREKAIEAYQAEHDRRMENVKEFNVQLTKLKLSAMVMDKEKAEEVKATLDKFPGISAQGLTDKVLQLPIQKRTQLTENIDKLEIAIKNETKLAREALGKKKAIENQIKDEKVDAIAKKVNMLFKDCLDSFKYHRTIFYNDLVPTIQEAYNMEPDFYKRIEKFNSNKNVTIAVQSFVRHGERPYLIDFLQKVMDLSDAYGPALLEKDFFSGSWPDDPQSMFFKDL